MEKLKVLGKAILSKLPIFIFCVAFIGTYNRLFGEENSIVGVVILTGLLMLMRGDFGFQVKQAALSIPLLLFIVAIAPKLSLRNPFLGLVVNIAAISIILVISSHDVSQGNHVPFLMGYIFCQGYDVDGKVYGMRVISILIGSVIIAVIYYLMNRKKEYKRTWIDLFKEIDIHSIRTQWYIRMTVTLTLVMFIGDLIQYPRMMWVFLTVLSLTTPFGEDHIAKGKVRIPAAILGTALFYLLFEVLIPIRFQGMVVMLAGFIAMFIQNYFVKSIYNSFSSLGAAVLLFSTKGAMELRIISNIIGTVVSVVSFAFFEVFFRSLSLDEKK